MTCTCPLPSAELTAAASHQHQVHTHGPDNASRNQESCSSDFVTLQMHNRRCLVCHLPHTSYPSRFCWLFKPTNPGKLRTTKCILLLTLQLRNTPTEVSSVTRQALTLALWCPGLLSPMQTSMQGRSVANTPSLCRGGLRGPSLAPGALVACVHKLCDCEGTVASDAHKHARQADEF